MKRLWVIALSLIAGCTADTGEIETAGEMAPDLETQAETADVSCEEACASGFQVFREFCNSKHVTKKQPCWAATNDYTARCGKPKAIRGCAPSCAEGYLVFAHYCEAHLNTKKCEKISRLATTKCLATGAGYR